MIPELSQIPCTVLLVDDEENILRAITRLIREESDLEVLTAASGALGVEALRAHPEVGLILSDQRMPGMTGAEFLQRARELAPDAVRMVLTGYADLSATMDAINKGGASRYLLKPWDDEGLLRAVGEGAAQYRLVQQNRQLMALVEKQNAELAEWNGNLKGRVIEQTATIRRQNEELKTRNQRIGRAFDQTLVVFSRLIEQHSSRLQEHTANVTRLCLAVARELGLSATETETVRVAALLHDIGVMGMATSILDKRMDLLTSEELGIFLQHAVRGQTAVDEVEELRSAGILIRHHHEHYDGSGFPDRLAGSDIPLGARIIACADFIDREMEELRGDTPLRGALARGGLEAGRRLDPEIWPLMRPHIVELYLPPRASYAEESEKELRPKQLLEGMLVTRDLYTASGLLLLTKGTRLDGQKIATVLRHYLIDPPDSGVHVSWRQTLGDEEGPSLRLGNGEQELVPRQLTEGMRISRNLYSGTGLLLLTEGTILDEAKIGSVTRYYQIDPPDCGIYVTKRKESQA